MPRPAGYIARQFVDCESAGRRTATVRCIHCTESKVAKTNSIQKERHLRKCPAFKNHIQEQVSRGDHTEHEHLSTVLRAAVAVRVEPPTVGPANIRRPMPAGSFTRKLVLAVQASRLPLSAFDGNKNPAMAELFHALDPNVRLPTTIELAQELVKIRHEEAERSIERYLEIRNHFAKIHYDDAESGQEDGEFDRP